jgi:hypothetical protein
MCGAIRHVRFTPNNDRKSGQALNLQSGGIHSSKKSMTHCGVLSPPTEGWPTFPAIAIPPYATKQGIILAEQGILVGEQGILSAEIKIITERNFRNKELLDDVRCYPESGH